ncbi:SCO family protein [Nocardioides sp.]|uniref:SCO family protein n=1 Tax=Nocardioides sp. TaxID=35761 RepID=UPI002C048E5A|nr:SCO family protein [Nocardioides sp.]HVX53738.1 SCO family protein [Nocardioides sp.]
MPRLRRSAPVALLLLLPLLLSGCGSSAGATGGGQRPSAPPQTVGTRLTQPVPADLLSLPLTDSTGAVRHLSDFAGKVVVISDSMTLCQETCPIDTATLVQTARQVDADTTAAKDVVFITLTVDPQRDTPAQLRAYQRQYGGGALPNWLLLTGKPADVHAIWKFFGVFWKKVPQDERVRNWRTGKLLTYDIQHSDELFFLDTRQRERYILDGMPTAPAGTPIPGKIKTFLSDEGRKNLHKNGVWTADQAVAGIAWLLGRPVSG